MKETETKIVMQDGFAKPKVLNGVMVITPQMAVTVTPRIAEELFEFNKNIRTLRSGTIKYYAEQMKKGNWILNGAAIIFDEKSNLVDGQHRLRACVESGVSFRTFIVCGGSEVGQDLGDPRTLKMLLESIGVKHVSVVSAAVNVIYGKKNSPDSIGWIITRGPKHNRGDKVPRASIQELLSFYQIHAEAFNRSAALCRNVKPSGLIGPGLLASLHYLFAERNPGVAALFVKALFGDLAVDPGDPVAQLRARLLKELPKNASKSSKEMRAALIIKAWNLWCRGERTKFLKWAASGPKPEPFPEIESPQS